MSCSRASALEVGDAVEDYLTFTAIDGDATIKFGWSEANKVMCSVDNGDNWFNYDKDKEIYLEKGESVKFKGSGVITGMDTTKSSVEFPNGFRTSGANLSVSGNLNSLRLDDNLINFAGLEENCFAGMFFDCKNLINASKLILDAEILQSYCYAAMFCGCTSLTEAPELSDTQLASYCYNSMFYGCTSLTQAPELPVTSLADCCYAAMFYGCTSLKETPKLPATYLTDCCYAAMFYGCTSLTKAPDLPATSLASNCYMAMFYGCTNLIKAPELPATTLDYYCYSEMFSGCISLIDVPKLPATSLAGGCYNHMFNGCTNLEFSELMTDKYNKEWTIKTDDGKSGYKTMFNGCIVNWLKYAPENSTVTLYQKEKDNLMASNGLTGSYNNKSETLSATSEDQETSLPQEPSDDIDPKYDLNTKSVSSNQLANSQDYESKSSKSLAASKNSDSVSSSSLTSNQSSYSGSSNAAKSSAIKTGELILNSTLLEFFLLMLLSFKRKRFGC